MHKLRTRASAGFTLIELLVVIAIIGLLAAIVLASLNSARTKGKDAAIKSEMSELQTLMALNYNDNSSYCQLQSGWINTSTSGAGSCAASFTGTYAAQAQAICATIVKNAMAPAPGSAMYTNTASFDCANSYSFMVPLNDGKWYCTGSSGTKAEYANGGSLPVGQPGCYDNP